MKKQFRNLFIALCIVLAVALHAAPLAARAATTDQQCDKLGQQFKDFTGTDSPNPLTGNCYSPGGLVNRGVVLGFTFAGTFAVLFIIIGGFYYMTSAGNEERAGKGKKMLTWAAIGLAVIVLAFTIVTVVSQFVVGR